MGESELEALKNELAGYKRHIADINKQIDESDRAREVLLRQGFRYEGVAEYLSSKIHAIEILESSKKD